MMRCGFWKTQRSGSLPDATGSGEQEFELLQPLLLGSTVTARGTVVEKFVKRSRTYVVVETTYHDQNGTLLARGRSENIVPIA